MKPKLEIHSWFLPKKGKRPNRACLQVQPYGQWVYVLWPVDADTLKSEYLHLSPDKTDWPEGAFDMGWGKFISNGHLECIAFSADKPTPGVIAHECFHYVKHLSRDLDLKGEEAKAYLIMYLTDRIYELTRGLPCRV